MRKPGVYGWTKPVTTKIPFSYYYLVADDILEIIISNGSEDFYTEGAHSVPTFGHAFRLNSQASRGLIRNLLSYKCLD
jgi:hypothetical protein